jgi:hypothetical protein
MDLEDLNPVFSTKLDALKAALDKQGIGYNLVSGYRSPEQQQQLFANGQARKAGQPLPYPNEEAPSVVAPPWRSFHNYGLAADFQLKNPADYSRLAAIAPQFGLTGIGASDPGHIQIAGTLASNIRQYNLANWRPSGQPSPSQGAVAYTGGPPAGQPPPDLVNRAATAQPSNSARDQHIQFIRDYATKIGLDPNLALGIAGAEGLNAWSGKNPNAASYVDRTGGQPFSFGDYQLNVHPGAMGAAALAKGIDPRDPSQWQAADTFALDQMKAGGVGPWRGDPVAKAYAATGKVQPFVPGTTLNTAGGPAVGSQTAAGGAAAAPGTGQPAQPPGASTGTLPGWQPGSPADKSMQAAMKQFGGGQGDQGQDDKPLDVPASPMIGGTPTPSGGRMMMGPGGQNAMGAMAAQQQLAQEGYLTQPSLASFSQMPMRSPIGAPPPGGSSPAQATGMPGAGVPGTTLNSPSQLQYALMTGYINPYDMYGAGGGYGAGMNSGSA